MGGRDEIEFKSWRRRRAPEALDRHCNKFENRLLMRNRYLTITSIILATLIVDGGVAPSYASRGESLTNDDSDLFVCTIGGVYLGLPASAMLSLTNGIYLYQGNTNVGNGVVGIAVGIPTLFCGGYMMVHGDTEHSAEVIGWGAVVASAGLMSTVLGLLNVFNRSDEGKGDRNKFTVVPSAADLGNRNFNVGLNVIVRL